MEQYIAHPQHQCLWKNEHLEYWRMDGWGVGTVGRGGVCILPGHFRSVPTLDGSVIVMAICVRPLNG